MEHVAIVTPVAQEEEPTPDLARPLFQADNDSQELFQIQPVEPFFTGFVEAKSSSERTKILELSLLALNEYMVDDVDRLVSNGAVNFLTLCLRRSLNESPISGTEIDGFCQIIQLMFLRCSDECGSSSIEKNGVDLICTMVQALIDGTCLVEHSSDSQGNISCNTNWWQDASNSILSTIDRVSNLNISLSTMNQSNQLILFLHSILRDNDSFRPIVHQEVLKILAGATRHPGSREFLMNIPSAVDDILSSANEMCIVSISPVASVTCPIYIIQLLRHLSLVARNKAVLLQKQHCVKLLLHFSSVGDLRVRLESMTTLLHLSQCRSGSHVILSKKYKKNIETLTSMCIATADDTELQSLALQTLLKLVTSSTAAKRLVQGGRLFHSLSEIVRSKNECTLGAARLIKRLASNMAVRDKGHAELLDAIVELSASENAQIRLLAAKSFFQQSSAATNRFLIARTRNVMHVIITLAGDSASAAVCAIASEALCKIAPEYKRLTYDSQLLPTLVKNIAKMDLHNEWSTHTVRCSVQTILTLAEHPAARERIAKQMGLLANLSTYAVSGDTDVELKKAALHGVIVLVPLI